MLAQTLPPGMLASRTWLLHQGFSVHSLDNALKSGEVVALVPGVYTQPGLSLNWQGVAASLNRIADQPVYIGGLSALELQGTGHYARASSQMHLYAFSKAPGWLAKLPVSTEFHWHNASKLWGNDPSVCQFQQESWWEGLPPYLVAKKEQAFIEVLEQVPQQVSFEHADQLAQSLTSLSPKRLDQALRHCQSIKAKRLLFFFAKRQRYAWARRLAPEDYDLGAGKRMLVPGGRLDRQLLITVPKAFYEQE
ncbi:MAG: hypothetical protein EA349_00120 [Halomonadaceae bacterium]|nr:MAG: hypothetical protein EA349_00120 [Halomonadaceae bacterium]